MHLSPEARVWTTSPSPIPPSSAPSTAISKKTASLPSACATQALREPANEPDKRATICP
jgi:hypothetical protein